MKIIIYYRNFNLLTKFRINSFQESNHLRKNPITKHIKLFYVNQMWSNYKIDKKHLTEIIKKNVKPVDTEFSIQLNIFYKIRKLKNIITLISLYM